MFFARIAFWTGMKSEFKDIPSSNVELFERNKI